jgi:HAD superfamily hydrolase (TIGR01549 family)
LLIIIYFLGDQVVIENIFLDAGGVILDEKKDELSRAALTVKILSKIDPEYSLAQYWRDVEKGVALFIPSLYRYIFWINTLNLELYRAAYSEYQLVWSKEKNPLVLMDTIAITIQTLSKKYRLGILGQYGNELKDVLSATNLLSYFTFTNTQEDFTITKPDPRYFERILKRAGVKPSNSIMVGDRIDKDVIPAKMIGMKTVRIKIGLHKNQRPRTPEEFPDYEIDSVSKLIDIL